MTAEEFRGILHAPEGTRLEFKTAANRYDFDELGTILRGNRQRGWRSDCAGATDTRPRRVVGTSRFRNPGRRESSIFQRVGHHVSIEEFNHEGHRS